MKIYLSRVFLTWNEWFITQISSVRQLSRPAAAPLLSSLLTKSSDAGKYSKHFLRWFTKAAFVDQPRKFWMGSQTHFGARRVDVWHACIGSTVLTQARAFLMSGRFLPLEKKSNEDRFDRKIDLFKPWICTSGEENIHWILYRSEISTVWKMGHLLWENKSVPNFNIHAARDLFSLVINRMWGWSQCVSNATFN